MPPTPIAILVFLAATLATQDGARTASSSVNLFRRYIKPVLTDKCLNCHNSEKKKGSLDLSRRDLALKGGKSGPALIFTRVEDSLLFQRISNGEMPPQNPLSAEQVTAFKQWIASGAAYEGEPLRASRKRAGADWWSLQPIRSPAIPAGAERSWIRTPIDAFILAKLKEKGLTPSPEADRRTLIRRATFDLLGLPPTPEEIDAFVQDPSLDAYERLIDRLLESPHYGERWGRHWLDIVRFAESHGYETNLLRFNAWPYRDYVSRAFNCDTPYPRFVLEQLAGDSVSNADWLVQSATGFLVGGAHDMVGNATVEGMLQQRMDDLDDMATAVGATFLGLTVNCARCHDHKFDPIAQRDYYGFQALLAGVQHADRTIVMPDAEQRKRAAAEIRGELSRLEAALDLFEPLAQPSGPSGRRSPVNPKRNTERFSAVAARYIRFSITATNNMIEPCIDELEAYSASEPGKNLALARAGAKVSASSNFPDTKTHRLEHLNDGMYGNSRSWISNELGKGWVQVELLRPAVIHRIVWGRDREEKFSDRLATEYRIELALEPGTWQVVASSADRLTYSTQAQINSIAGLSADRQARRTALLEQQARLRERLATLQSSSQIYAGTFSEPGLTHVLLRGDPMRKGEEVKPAALAAIPVAVSLNRQSSERERRIALARWIADPRNPLPARVMVNRAWHYHFGQGIVATPSDFGFNGDRPSHPELLDWLAAEYIRTGWRLKPLHRLMMLSSTYRQASRANPRGLTADQQNRLLWRMTPRRLEAEAVRDAILSASGKLDLRMGGPGYSLWEKNTNYVVVFKAKDELGPVEFRRMVYQFKPRSQQDPTFGIFDCPDAALARPRRTISTTALQALSLLNSQFIVSQADFFADRVAAEAGIDSIRQARRAFELAFGRVPLTAEQVAAVELIGRHGLGALCRALYNANEFLYAD
jgi:hypothetical protein